MIYCIINIIGNIIIVFASVAFLIVKAAWQVILPICFFILAYMVENRFWKWNFYKSFSSWRALALQKLSKFGTKKPSLKTAYIIFAVIIGFALLILFIALYSQLSYIISGNVKTTISTIDSNFALAFLGTISGGVALFTGYMAILRSGTNERETRTAEEGLITDRLNKATEGLGKKDGEEPLIEVRLGSLYALERIAQDSLRDHVQIMEILCAYIRHNSPLRHKAKRLSRNTKEKIVKPSQKKNKKDGLREDIQAALTIIGRRGRWTEDKKHLKKEEDEGYEIDLSNCDLSDADLIGANLRNAWLDETNLSGAFLIRTDLRDAWLTDAILNNAGFDNIKLGGANLKGAKTKKVLAREANLSNCQTLTQKQLNDMFLGKNVKIPNNRKHPQFGTDYYQVYTKIEDFGKAYNKWFQNK